MSNITLFSSGAEVPAYLREGSDAMTKELAGGSGGKQISIKGGVWRMIVGGEEVAKNEDRSMNLVVVGVAKGISRTYYEGKYEEGKDNPPVCWSAEGVLPNSEVKDPKSAACGTCPMNIEGSGEGKSRACRFSKRIAVVLESDIGGNVYRMSVPAKSFFGRADGEKMPLQAFGKFLAGHNIPITGIVTEARFDTSEAVPVMKFRASRPLKPAEWEAAKMQGASTDAQQAIEFKMVPPKSRVDTIAAPVATEEPPIKRPKKAPEVIPATKDTDAILSEWGTDDDE